MSKENFEELDNDPDLIDLSIPQPYLSEEQRIELEAELFGRKALDKLYELKYQWDGNDWILPEPTTDEGMLDES